MELTVFSMNLRTSNAKDGINCFENRKPRIAEVINRYSPDLIGFQEVDPVIREFLVNTFDSYYMVGAGRNADYSGESSLIAFKKTAFDLLSLETKMLSSAPSVQGSRYSGSDQSGCPRVYTKAVLKHHAITEPIVFYNVHTDHKGSLARTLASVQMLQDVTSHTMPFIFTGDFNAKPDKPEIQIFLSEETRKIVDVTAGLAGTFHDFGRREPIKIDYIFTDPRFKALRCEMVEDKPVDGIYISDHNPVYAVLDFE